MGRGRFGLVCGRPGSEQPQALFGCRAGFGGVDGQGEAGLGSEFQALEGERELADNFMVEALGAGAVVADVVGAPAGAELLAAGGQFTDQVVQILGVGVAARFGAQDGDGDVGEQVPVSTVDTACATIVSLVRFVS